MVNQQNSQSYQAIQRLVFKIYDRWETIEDKSNLLNSYINDPNECPKAEIPLIQVLINLKRTTPDFDEIFVDITNKYNEFDIKKRQMTKCLTLGKIDEANNLKEGLLQEFQPLKNTIEATYNSNLQHSLVLVRNEINDLISDQKFDEAKQLLHVSRFLSSEAKIIEEKITFHKKNFEIHEKATSLIKQKLFSELIQLLNSENLSFSLKSDLIQTIKLTILDSLNEAKYEDMHLLIESLDLSFRDIDDLHKKLYSHITNLADKKFLLSSEQITKHFIAKLKPYPEEIYKNLLDYIERCYRKMDSHIQMLIDTNDYDKASDFVGLFELEQSKSARLLGAVKQSSKAAETKIEVIEKLNRGEFFESYSLIKDTMFSTSDKAEIIEKLTSSLKQKLDVNEIDYDQALSLICNHQYQLISARAGSGKTTTLVNKVKLLYSLNKISHKDYLFLAFNKKVRKEIATVISETFNINIEDVKNENVHTFHSFARSITAKSLQEFDLVEGESQANLYKKCFLNSLKDSQFLSLYRNYLSTIINPEIDDQDRFDRSNFETDVDYFFARSKAKLLTLNNQAVKSLGEKLIGDFFFEHDLICTYEPTRITNDNKIYRPDFYINHLTDTSDRKIYIELWGIYKNEAAGFSTAPFDIDQYKSDRLKKIEYWNQNDKSCYLLELFMDDVYGANLNANEDFIELKEHFYKILSNKIYEITGKRLKRLSFEEVISRVGKVFESRILGSLNSYIDNVKNNQINNDDLNLKINKFSDVLSKRAKAFLELGFEFRKSIHREKLKSKLYEYSDSIAKAALEIESNKVLTPIKDKKYLFVDEFQDTNFGFLRILLGIKQSNPDIQIICVGDDWQSINSFMGAKVSIFQSLSNYFPNLEKNHILTNYRSGEEIVNYGNNIMSGFGRPSLSSSNSGLVTYLDIYDVRNSRDFNIYLDDEHNKYDDGFKLQRYHKLLYDLLLHEILECISNSDNKSIYTLHKEFNFLLLSRNKKINGESIEHTLKPILINSLAKGLKNHGFIESKQELIISLNQIIIYSSIHAIKGGEADTAILLEADLYNMPMRHPDRELSAIFYDDPRYADSEADDEERRLYYVAATRAKRKLYVISSSSEKSPFMSNREFSDAHMYSQTA